MALEKPGRFGFSPEAWGRLEGGHLKCQECFLIPWTLQELCRVGFW